MLRETIVAVREDIEAGLSSPTRSRHPKVFNPLYVAMVRAGEAGGVLEESLERVADQLEKDDSLRRQVKSAMAYPTVVISFALIVLIAHGRVHRPRLRRGLQGLRRRAAAITKFTVALSNVVTGQWYILLAARSARRRLPQVEDVLLGPPAVGRVPAAHPVQDRRRPSRRSRSRAGRARSPRSTPPACRSCRRSR